MKNNLKNRGGGWSLKSQRKQQETYLVNQAKNSVGKKDNPESVDSDPSGSPNKGGHLVK